jgi:hypothetical protein
MLCIFPPTRVSIKLRNLSSSEIRRSMLTQVIWWSSIALESLLLFRGLRGRLASRYPAFYFYIFFVLLQDLVCFAIRQRTHGAKEYEYAYWTAEFLCVLVSCGIVLEIYQLGLASYPGTARMARRLLGLIFAIVVVKTMVNIAVHPEWWTDATAKGVEGTLRAIQGVAVISLVALFLFYSIPFGRNLRGIILSYGLLVCFSVICLTIASATASLRVHTFLAFLYPASYPVFLTLWLVPLWSYEATPQPKYSIPLEVEYQRIASATQRRLQDARSYVARAVGS